jgi:3-deoxy-manno-octulosonate cytidylyltransferase (CMP-KDO synthetase)
MKIIGIIPARYNSTRFPGKALAIIEGISMLQRVYQQASKSKQITDLIIATDDERIVAHAKSFGANVVVTKPEHISGTDRCFEAYQNNNKQYDLIINIQGDEPFLEPEQIDSLCLACDNETQIATQMIKCTSEEVLFDTGEVKIVLNDKNEALYFSRSVIPFLKGVEKNKWHLNHTYFRHVGMYAYKPEVLKNITCLKTSKLEIAESLEQLRWLEAGFSIKCCETTYESHCVDTIEDIEKVLKMMKK